MAKTIANIQIDPKSLDPIKKLIEASPDWLKEVSERVQTPSEKKLSKAFLSLIDEE